MTVRVVTGPPCSGKTTHVREHAGPLDVVVDLDQIAHALGYPHPHVDWSEPTPHPARVAALRARASLVKAAIAGEFDTPCVWIIDAAPSAIASQRYVNAGALVITIDPGAEVCHDRARTDDRTDATHDEIERWYGDLGTTSTDW